MHSPFFGGLECYPMRTYARMQENPEYHFTWNAVICRFFFLKVYFTIVILPYTKLRECCIIPGKLFWLVVHDFAKWIQKKTNVITSIPDVHYRRLSKISGDFRGRPEDISTIYIFLTSSNYALTVRIGMECARQPAIDRRNGKTRLRIEELKKNGTESPGFH